MREHQHSAFGGGEPDRSPPEPREAVGGDPTRHPFGPAGLAALQRSAGNAATARLLEARRPKGPRVAARAHRAEVAVQRTPYLANADDLIYGDSDDPTRELAYLGKLWSTDCFVPYSAVYAVRTWYALTRLKASGWKPKPSKVSSRGILRGSVYKPSDRGTRATRTGAARRGGGGVIAKDDTMSLLGLMKETEQDEAALGRLQDAVGGLLVLDRGAITGLTMEPRHVTTLARGILESGPQEMRTGGGSRLPSPVGKVRTSGPLSKDQLLSVLGVPEDKRPNYDKVTVKVLTPAAYLDSYAAAAAAGANLIQSSDLRTGVWFFYVSDLKVARSGNSRIQVAGTVYASDPDFLGVDPASSKGTAITASYNGLSAPVADTGWLPGTRLTRMDRGEGQASAMAKWNALGAAAYTNRFLGTAYDLGQNWEWLHVQGAQIGGRTVQGNLVAGLYVTNSAMIPFESMVERWARAGPSSFEASFRAVGTAGPFASQIEIWIRAHGHPVLGDFPDRRLAAFDPVSGRVVDKLAGEIVKREIDRTTRV